MLKDNLVDYGLSEKEAKIYLTLLELGASTVINISKKSKINRISVYDVLRRLQEKGLVSYTLKNSTKHFEATETKHLLTILDDRKKKIEDIIDDLESLQKQRKEETKVEIFEGQYAYKNVFEDIIKHKPNPLLAFSSVRHLSDVGKYYVNQFIKRRAKEGIFLKYIYGDPQKFPERKSKDKEELRETRFLPNFKVKNGIYIYGNKTAVFDSYLEHAIVIEDENFADSMRLIFNKLWEQTNHTR